MANQTLDSWGKLAISGKLGAVGSKPITAEQMELNRCRADNARLKMERDILKKATAAMPNIIAHKPSHLLNRQFKVAVPNQVSTGDITYIRTE